MALLFGINQSCSTEDVAIEQQSTIETISKNEAISFVKNFNDSKKTTAKISGLQSEFEFDKVTQEKLTSTTELLTVIPIKTKTENQRRRALFLRVGANIESMIYHEFAQSSFTNDTFSGIVLMTRLNGDFIRAYRLKNNEYIIDLVPSKKPKSSQKTALRTNESGDSIELDEVVVYSRFTIFNGFVPLTNLANEVPISITWDPNYNGGGGSGGGAFSAPVVEEEKDPCSIAKNMTKDALDSTYISAKSNIEKASSDGLEHSITLGRDASGKLTQAPIRTGGQNAVAVNTSWSGAFAALHNHPNNTQLSAGDIYLSIKLNTMNSNFTTSYILTDGQLYAIVVTDLVSAQNFAAAYPADQLPGFNPEFPDVLFNQLQTLVTPMGSSIDGKTKAIAYVLNQYNAGITLLKQNSIGEFEPIKPEETINSDGTKSYTTKPCN